MGESVSGEYSSLFPTPKLNLKLHINLAADGTFHHSLVSSSPIVLETGPAAIAIAAFAVAVVDWGEKGIFRGAALSPASHIR